MRPGRAAIERATRVVGDAVRLVVVAKPKSPRPGIEEGKDGAIVVRVTAPPEDGKANAAIIDVVADALSLSRRDVAIVRGDTSRHKELAITGVTLEEARARLA